MADVRTASPAADDAALPLPADPEQAPSLAPGEADDWIAKLADAQIDALLNDAPAAEAATPVARSASPESPTEEPPAFPASFSPPGGRAAPALDAHALLNEMNSVSDEPVRFHAPRPEPKAAEPKPVEPLAKPDEPAAALEAPSHSDADAVAAELAADAMLSPRFAPTPAAAPEPVADSVHATPDAPAAAAEPAAHAAASVPTAHRLQSVALGAIDALNAPSRALSDGQRETVGAIAIVTLANATALLFYLILFRQ